MCIHLQSQKLTFTWNDMFARYFACAYRPGEVCAYRPGAYVCPNYYCTFTTLSPCPTIISSTGPVGWFCIALTVAPSPADVVSKIRTKYTEIHRSILLIPELPLPCPTVYTVMGSGVGGWGWEVGGWVGLAAEKRFWIPALGFSPLQYWVHLLWCLESDSFYPGLKNFVTSVGFLLLHICWARKL